MILCTHICMTGATITTAVVGAGIASTIILVIVTTDLSTM
jgi:hypothetical protein